MSDALKIVFGVLLLIALCFRGALVDNQVAIRTMNTQGYSNPTITDTSYFAVGFRGCDMNDSVRYTVTAKNPAGSQVQLYVCAALWKGGTIRTQ